MDMPDWVNSVDTDQMLQNTLLATHPALILDTSTGSKIIFFQILE